jgi:hypothetical protein
MFNRLSFPALATFAVLATTAFSPATAANQWGGSTYRGYHIDLSSMNGRENFAAMAEAMRQQIDIVESVGLNPRVLEFFRAVPITMEEGACAQFPGTRACYTGGGVMVPPSVLDAQKAVILHEMLHAFHAHLLPQGVQNADVLRFYDRAIDRGLYPAGEHLLRNQKEFFAMTASVFLYGKIAREPYTRANLKQKQPLYYEFLARLFGVNPASEVIASSAQRPHTASATFGAAANQTVSPSPAAAPAQNRTATASAPPRTLLAMALSWNPMGGWVVQRDSSADVAGNRAVAECNRQFGNCALGATVAPTAPGCLAIAHADQDASRLFAGTGDTADASRDSLVQQLRNEGLTGELVFSDCNGEHAQVKAEEQSCWHPGLARNIGIAEPRCEVSTSEPRMERGRRASNAP